MRLEFNFKLINLGTLIKRMIQKQKKNSLKSNKLMNYCQTQKDVKHMINMELPKIQQICINVMITHSMNDSLPTLSKNFSEGKIDSISKNKILHFSINCR